ncbi:MAG: ribonuclease HII [Nanoarchaeota archaeon]|nr:ribonuclease HII [Nanoarchaeota archaeon]
MAGVLIKEKDESKLSSIGVKDSKLLTKQQRNSLYKKIIKIAKKYKILITGTEEIDKAVKGHDGLNLNWLEANKSAEIINSLKPEKAIIDCPSNNIQKYKDYLSKKIKQRKSKISVARRNRRFLVSWKPEVSMNLKTSFSNDKKTELILEHKADLNHPVVAAASILAKVTRDNEIEKIKQDIKIDFGSGYPSDPITKEFLEKNHRKYSKIFRKSWSSYKEILNKKFQKKLEGFSQFIEKVEDKNENMKGKLKKLEDFGYKSIPVKTQYESVRLKGPCTITLYKNGKLLIQGKEENKKVIEKLIK